MMLRIVTSMVPAFLALGLALIPLDGMAANATNAADTANARLDAELAAIVNDEAHPLASLSVLAIRDGKIVYQRQFGRRFIDTADPANSKPADANSLYRIASISKLVTTLGVMRLVEQGKLRLDADVGEYLGYPLRNPNFPEDAITLRMLLTHTSSLRDGGGYYWPAPAKLKDALLPGGKLYDKGGMWAKNAKPGAFFQYANLPWGVIGTIMERVSGERFDHLMKRLVLDPMGLHGGFNPAEFSAADLGNIAVLYRKRSEIDGKEIWNSSGPWIAQVDDYSKNAPVPRAGPDYEIGSNGTVFGPQGNVRLSAADLGKIMLMLMNGGTHEGRVILKPETVNTMLAAQWRFDAKAANGSNAYGDHQDQFNEWGLGNQHFLDLTGPGRGDRLVEGGGFKAVGHFGDAWGLTSSFVFDPAKRNGMIFLIGGPGFDPETNRGLYSAQHRHEERILTAMYRRALLGEEK